MEFFELINIAARYMEIENPISREKILLFGKHLRLQPGSRVIDFGCGYGEALVLWAEAYGISGVGVDVRPHACARAIMKAAEHDLTERIEIVCARGDEYAFEEGSFDVATCIGATFIWGGFAEAVDAMKRAVHRSGRLGIGEQIWRRPYAPPAYALQEARGTYFEYELLQMAHAAGCEIEHIVRASDDDWDRYETDLWHGMIRWLEENPIHPDRQQVIDRLHHSQDTYLRYGREYMGWAMYALAQRSQ